MGLIGIHQQYQGSVDRTTPEKTLAEYPLTEATREFNANPIDPQNLIPKVEKVCRQVWDAGLIPVWSVKCKPEAVRNGKWRPFFEQLASHLKAQNLDKRFILVIWHEPENDVPKWFKNAGEFVAMFNTVHGWVKTIAPNILTSHAALGYRYGDVNKGSMANPKWKPIDIDDATAKLWKTKADIHTLDLYQGRSWPLSQIAPENSAFKRWKTHLVGTDLWGFSERGFIANASKPLELSERIATLRREADWLAGVGGHDCVMALLWDTIGVEGDQNIPIRDAEGKEAVRYYMARYKERDQEPEPEPETPAEPETVQCPLCSGVGTVPKGATYTVTKMVM